MKSSLPINNFIVDREGRAETSSGSIGDDTGHPDLHCPPKTIHRRIDGRYRQTIANAVRNVTFCGASNIFFYQVSLMVQKQELEIIEDSTPTSSEHLRMGGSNPQGRSFEVNNYYLLRDGKACIPVMGEFHFSRYQSQNWEDELLKMKAGGIDIVATYVFWIHVEEEEGIFDWSGNKSLRQFISLCARHDLLVLVRVGPFAHGECRNGGLPDWIYGRPFTVRSNDPVYLGYVKRWYREIAKQLDGFLFKENGPVIGIQLDNEYMHCGAPWEVTLRPGMEWVPSGSDGVEHIVRLKQLAIEAGLDVPIYTCTGWLNSPIIDGDILPMQGGYAFTPWSPDPNYRQGPTREFIFRNRHLHPIGNGEPTYDSSKYPYACCEIGSGIQITYYHRPVVPAEAVEALALVNLADGANILGYYVYHGGSNPIGKHSFMNEYTVPRISYDFQAPLREFGQVADSYRSLRLLHLFLKDFGESLAPMSVSLPSDASLINPEDNSRLRYAVRSKNSAGFLFLNNYQDHVEMQDLEVQVQLKMPNATISIPNSHCLTLKKDVCAILPFGMSFDGVYLEYATAQPFARIDEDDTTSYFFFGPRGISSEFVFDPRTYVSITVTSGEVVTAGDRSIVTVAPGLDCVISLTISAGKTIRIFTLTREQAERCSKQELWEKERILISAQTLVTTNEHCRLYSTGGEEIEILVYPPIAQGDLKSSFGPLSRTTKGSFTAFTGIIPQKKADFQFRQVGTDKAILSFPRDILDDVDDILLRIEYVGDMGNAFVGGKLVHDNFYNGTTWEIGLRHLGSDIPEKEILIKIDPLRAHNREMKFVPTGVAFRPESSGDALGMIRSVTAVPQYKIVLTAS
jgi:hypothetical protein